MTKKTRNSELLTSFNLYCTKHPEQRFFQALRNWAGVGFIWAGNSHEGDDIVDTFFWEKVRK